MARQALLPTEGEPVVVNETQTQQRLVPGPVYLNETGGGGGGTPTRRRQMAVVN